jgi:hypothetical protein
MVKKTKNPATHSMIVFILGIRLLWTKSLKKNRKKAYERERDICGYKKGPDCSGP